MLDLYRIIFSSILYYLALHYNTQLYWLIFAFAVPVFLSKTIGFKEGFVWGLIFYSLHFKSFFKIFYYINQSVIYTAPIIILICYMSLICGLCFFLARYIGLFFSLNLMFFTINYGSGFFIEPLCGYALSAPVIAFAGNGCLLSIAKILPKEFITATCILMSLLLSKIIQTKRLDYFLYFFAILICLMLLPCLVKKDLLKLKFERVDFCAQATDPLARLVAIKREIDKITKIKNIDFVVTQESTFNFNFNEFDFCLDWFKDSIDILFHTHFCDGNKTYNVILHISKGRVVEVHYKGRLVPIAEYLPQVFRNNFFKDCFIKDGHEICSTKSNNYFYIHNVKVKPLICSEAFIESFFDRFDRTQKIIIYNTSWFDSDYVNLMRSYCRIMSL